MSGMKILRVGILLAVVTAATCASIKPNDVAQAKLARQRLLQDAPMAGVTGVGPLKPAADSSGSGGKPVSSSTSSEIEGELTTALEQDDQVTGEKLPPGVRDSPEFPFAHMFGSLTVICGVGKKWNTWGICYI